MERDCSGVRCSGVEVRLREWRQATIATPSLSGITVTEITVRKVGSCYLPVVFATQARGGPS
jgi:hypothetical protein